MAGKKWLKLSEMIRFQVSGVRCQDSDNSGNGSRTRRRPIGRDYAAAKDTE
jgi:hypothetical protein